MTRITESFYVQLQAERHRNNRIYGFKAARVTRKKPTLPVEDSVIVKVRMSIDPEAFEQLPIVDIDVPLSAIETAQVTAVAGA